MRIPALLLSALLLASAAPATFSQDGGGKRDDVKVMTSSDWERVMALYKHSQGGDERFDGLKTLSFDFTPVIIDQDGKEQVSSTRHVTYLLRPNADDQEVRTMRIETKVPFDDADGQKQDVNTVSIVTSQSVKVWTENAPGEYSEIEARELQAAAVFDAKGLWAQLDLILYPDTTDLRCTFSGVLTRDSKRYAAVEAEFRPGRQVPEPARLYFSAVSSLIERIDVFDPKTHLRTATTYLEGYKDHDGIKFPETLRFVDRRGKALGAWRFANVKLNPTLAEGQLKKP